MAWFKVDDTLAFHQKTIAAGNAAMGLWVRAGSWSMQTLSDGFIPEDVRAAMGTKAQAQKLIDAGLWDRLPSGYAFHEWDSRQPSKEDVEHMNEVKGSAATYGNHVRWHRNRCKPEDDCNWCQKDKKEAS